MQFEEMYKNRKYIWRFQKYTLFENYLWLIFEKYCLILKYIVI